MSPAPSHLQNEVGEGEMQQHRHVEVSRVVYELPMRHVKHGAAVGR